MFDRRGPGSPPGGAVQAARAHGGPMRVLVVIGTRPEAIKMASVVHALRRARGIEAEVCVTGQHREMLRQVLDAFDVAPAHDLDVMRADQDLTSLTTAILEGMRGVLARAAPDWMLVHGDTTTTLAAALAGFYAGVPVAHVEAGLRTGDLRAPWPEEMNRSVVGRLAALHFAPTERARAALLAEAVAPGAIHVTGNTVIDTLLMAKARLGSDGALRARADASLPALDPERRMILVTGHRRESFGPGFERFCAALADLAARPDVEIVYPVHLNPNVREPVMRLLGGLASVHLIEPLDYLPFVHAMTRAALIITDSGGVQEEAPSLGKPVLVTRETTERPEAVEAGTVVLVGTDRARIVGEAGRLLDDPAAHEAMARAHNPYGDGHAAGRIARVLEGLAAERTREDGRGGARVSVRKVSIVGLGYIGLPTAALFASRRIDVLGVDVSRRVVDTVNAGEVHIVEPELDMLVRATVAAGHLRASTTPEPADVFVVAVPTPFTEDHRPDLGHVEAACRLIAPVLAAGNLVILESTSPIGATERMASWLAEARPDLRFPGREGPEAEVDVQVAHCPERVLPGRVVRELVHNDRVVGGLTPEAGRRAAAFYRLLVEGECVLTDARTAEMCKLVENSFRDVNIAFANELSLIAARHGIDVRELIALANRHPRVDILQPGTGVGGHCIAVDPWFLVSDAPEEARLIRTAREVNDAKPLWVRDAIGAMAREAAGGRGDAVRIACLGLAFKPDVDDLRESPAMQVAVMLAEEGHRLLVVEPHIDALPERLRRPGVELTTLEDALARAQLAAVLVRHSAFVERLRESAPTIPLFDAVGLPA